LATDNRPPRRPPAAYASAQRRLAGVAGPRLNLEPTAGLPTAGLPTAGLPTAGLPTAGLPTAGLPTAGLPTAGRPTAGLLGGRPPGSRQLAPTA
jgi:hypothetical protein